MMHVHVNPMYTNEIYGSATQENMDYSPITHNKLQNKNLTYTGGEQ